MEIYTYAHIQKVEGKQLLVIGIIEDYSESRISSGRNFFEFLYGGIDIRDILSNPDKYSEPVYTILSGQEEENSWGTEEEALARIAQIKEHIKVIIEDFSDNLSIYDLTVSLSSKAYAQMVQDTKKRNTLELNTLHNLFYNALTIIEEQMYEVPWNQKELDEEFAQFMIKELGASEDIVEWYMNEKRISIDQSE